MDYFSEKTFFPKFKQGQLEYYQMTINDIGLENHHITISNDLKIIRMKSGSNH